MLVSIDPMKLMHWLNARKVTVQMAAQRAGLPVDLIQHLSETEIQVPASEARRLAEALHVSVDHLAAQDATPPVIYASRAEIQSTRREVNRGGIHFYNYYTLPTPKGHIAPVLIDILCPKDRMPTQNNGHLEPAITINLGPGDINGLWGQEINPHTWHVLHACRDRQEPWILGDSYVEPSFCPHTYARASDEPAQILSYTVKSNLEALLSAANGWSSQRFEALVDDMGHSADFAGSMLRSHMERRGYDLASLARVTGIGVNALAAFLEGDSNALDLAELKHIGKTLSFDYRILLRPATNHDPVGKTLCTVRESRASIRRFKSYTVASMSLSPSLPDLTGLFIKVAKPSPDKELDLSDHGASQYYVTSGSMTFHWIDVAGCRTERALASGDALWVAPYVRHAFAGNGSLIKMGNGEGFGYLDHFELSNTYHLAATLRRGWRDRQPWSPVSGPVGGVSSAS